MALSDIDLKIDKWSKCTLVGALLLLIYSFAVLSFTHKHFPHERFHEHHHDHDAHHHHHEDMPHRLHHFAVLGMITGITGIISSFTMKRGWALLFLVFVLVTEITALGIVSYSNATAVVRCQAATTSQKVTVTDNIAIDNKGRVIERVDFAVGKKSIDQAEFHDCMHGIRHAAVIASLIIGVAACSLACCSSRYSNALLERDLEEVDHAAVVAAIASVPTMAIVVDHQMTVQQKEAELVEIVETSSSDEKAPLV